HLRKLSENESRWYFQQLIDAVDYCHSKGVYHRDLKVLNQQGYDGSAADVWSCGVILYVLMAGYLPFNETDLPTLYKKVLDRYTDCLLPAVTIDWCYFRSVIARLVPVDFDRCHSLSGGISRGRRKKREKKRENLEIECRSPSVNPIRRSWGEEASARLLGENKLRRLREEENDVSSLYAGRRNEGVRPRR
ncbi:hypothetical protein BHM03_00058363, partial [Ensete ventricosum]